MLRCTPKKNYTRNCAGLIENSEDPLKPLSEITVDHRSIVRQLRGGKDFMGRMAALGFTVGSKVKVIQNQGHGPLIVLIRDTRVALGRGEALKVLVEEINEKT
jgi:ferrous iron transport protein A